MKNKNKFAFTLAEIMIVLSIIGILSAILLPTAFHATPDKNILKFKKAHNTLYSAVREMVNSDRYYHSGNLSYPNIYDTTMLLTCANKSSSSDSRFSDKPYGYFCKAFSDIVSSKESTCNGDGYGDSVIRNVYYLINELSEYSQKVKLDKACLSKLTESSQPFSYKDEIKANDDVIFFGLGMAFARDFCSMGSVDNCSSPYKKATDDFGNEVCVNEDGFDFLLNPFCIDLDDFKGNVKPFGYGIRADGKIVSGARADWWLSRDVTKKETDCCPKKLSDNGLCDDGDTVCD